MPEKPKAITTSNVEAPRPAVREHAPALTTNTIQPPLPTRPSDKDRKPAKGPMITTGNIEEIKRQYAETETKTAPIDVHMTIEEGRLPQEDPLKKKTRAKKAKEE